MSSKSRSKVSARAPLCPSLPPELWVNVFSYHTDLAHLWIVCRRVSSTLRACAELAFRDYFLHDVFIDFQLEKYNLGGKSRRPEVPVSFDQLDKCKERDMACYRDQRAKDAFVDGKTKGKEAQEHYARVLQRWEENVVGCRAEMPNYTITIGGLVNDTALPDLDIDIEKREVRFNWRRMLHLFYREHDRLGSMKQTWQAETSKKIRANKNRIKNGEKLMPADYPSSWAAAEAQLRKEIRRARLKEHYRDNEEMIWAIESLKHFEEYGAATGTAKAFKLNADLPGAGLGERWFGSTNLVQELYLDEWSCMHRIDTKIEHLQSGLAITRGSVGF